MHLDVFCSQWRSWLRGGHEYSQRHFQYRYSFQDCKVQNHLLRPCKQTQPQAQTARTQRSLCKRIDHKGLKSSVNRHPLVHGKRVMDLMLLTPFSSETRHSGFLQDLINTYPTPAMCAHRPPTQVNGLTRALTASKYSPLHCRDVFSPCLRSPRYFLPEHLDVSKVDETVTWQGRLFRPTIIGKESGKPRKHLSRASGRFHMRTCVLALFSLASEHSPLHLREVVRSQEVEEHCVRSRLRTL